MTLSLWHTRWRYWRTLNYSNFLMYVCVSFRCFLKPWTHTRTQHNTRMSLYTYKFIIRSYNICLVCKNRKISVDKKKKKKIRRIIAMTYDAFVYCIIYFNIPCIVKYIMLTNYLYYVYIYAPVTLREKWWGTSLHNVVGKRRVK